MQAAERYRRESSDLASLQLPRAEARLQAQVTKARAEGYKLREALHEREEQLAAGERENRALRDCITSLQVADALVAGRSWMNCTPIGPPLHL